MEQDLIWELLTQTGQVSGLEMAVKASSELPSSVCPGCPRMGYWDWVHTHLHCYVKTVLWGTLNIYFRGLLYRDSQFWHPLSQLVAAGAFQAQTQC